MTNRWELFLCIDRPGGGVQGVGQCNCAKWRAKAWWQLLWAINSCITKVAMVTIISIASLRPIA